MGTISQFNSSWTDVLDRLHTPIWIFDLTLGCIHWGNLAAADFWGVGDELSLQDYDMLSGMSQSMRQRLINYQPILLQGDAITDSWFFYPGGQPRNIMCTCSGIYVDAKLAALIEAHPNLSFNLREIVTPKDHRDPLTDLPQQAVLDEFLEHSIAQAERRGSLISVLFLEADPLDDAALQVSSLDAEKLRDLALAELARRLCTHVRRGDLVSRCATGEFAIVITDLRRMADLDVLIEKLLNTVNEPFMIDGEEIYLSLSMGSSLYPRDGSQCDILLARAYAAMYRAKAVDEGAYRPFF